MSGGGGDGSGRGGNGSGRSGRKPKAGLSAEEQALWEHAAASMKPLWKAKPRVPDNADEAPAAQRRRVKLSEPEAPAGKPAARGAVAAVSKSARVAKPAAELAGFDRRSARKLRSGRIEIEARLDLHGLRQDEAHDALRGFVLSCHRRGLRWVLVITGKGAPRRTGHDDTPFDGSVPRDRGILRRNVPMWLSAPDLSAIVVSFAPASAAHGGEGALYLHLRSAHRAGPST